HAARHDLRARFDVDATCDQLEVTRVELVSAVVGCDVERRVVSQTDVAIHVRAAQRHAAVAEIQVCGVHHALCAHEIGGAKERKNSEDECENRPGSHRCTGCSTQHNVSSQQPQAPTKLGG